MGGAGVSRYVGAWIGILVAAGVLFWAVAFVVSPFGPACVTSRPGVEPHPVVPLWVAIAGPLGLATGLVGLLWTSRRMSAVGKFAGLVFTGAATIAAITLGIALTPVCT